MDGFPCFRGNRALLLVCHCKWSGRSILYIQGNCRIVDWLAPSTSNVLICVLVVQFVCNKLALAEVVAIEFTAIGQHESKTIDCNSLLPSDLTSGTLQKSSGETLSAGLFVTGLSNGIMSAVRADKCTLF